MVPHGETLKIEAGVEVKFKSSIYTDLYDKPDFDFDLETLKIGMLLINGKIKAEGTYEDSIKFTRYGDNGKWGIILIKDSDNNAFKHCIFEHSNYIIHPEDNSYVGAVSLYNSSAILSENRFMDNEYDGIEGWLSDSINILNNEFYRNRRGVYCKLSNCNIEHNYFCENRKGIHCYDHSSPDIVNNIFDSCGYGVACFNYSNPYISNCITRYCTNAIYMEYSSPYIISNLIINNSQNGINCVDDLCNPEIINNTIVNNQHYGIERSLNALPNIVNNLFWGNGYASIRFFEHYSKPLVSYSLIQESEIPPESDAGNNIFDQDPRFIDPDLDNFQLLNDSPCIDSGWVSDIFNWLPVDILGNSRISGESVDIGCVEYQHELSN